MMQAEQAKNPAAVALGGIYSYDGYKVEALKYLSNYTEADQTTCKDFFKSLDEIKPKLLNAEEKLILARVFVQCACYQKESIDVPSFIKWACHLKESTGTTYFTQIFEASVTPDNA